MAWFSPKPLTVPEIIGLNAASLGNKAAVIVDDLAVSWREFGDGTARIANAMLDAGMRPGERVVILMNNSYEMAEAMFGVTRAGLCAVPLNCSITNDAVAGMIADSDARAVIASDEHIARIDGLRERRNVRTSDRRRCNRRGLALLPCLARCREIDAAGRGDPARGRMQHHLQLGYHRPAQGYRPRSCLP